MTYSTTKLLVLRSFVFVMFTSKDMLSLDYFNVLSSDDKGNLELQSRNTGHCWMLVHDGHGYSMYHKHLITDNYHYQTEVGNIYDFVLYVVSHDEYQLRGRRSISRERERKNGSLFFALIDRYGVMA